MRNLVLLLFALAVTVSCSCSSGSKDAGPDKAQKETSYDMPVSVGEAVLAGDDSTNALIEQGQNLEKQLLYYDALYRYLKAKIKNRNLLPAAAGITRVYMRLDFDEEVALNISQYAALAGNYYPAHYDLARLYIYLNDYPAAAKHIEQARTDGLEPAVAGLVEARILALEGNIDSARQTAAPLLAQPSKSALYFYEAADYLESVGLADSAMMLSRKAWSAEDSNFDILYDHFQRAVRNFYMRDARLVMKEIEKQTGAEVLLYGLEYRYNKALNKLTAASQSMDNVKRLTRRCLSANLADAEIRGPIFDYVAGADDLDRSYMAVMKETEVPDFKNLVQYRAAQKYLIIGDYNKARNHFDELSGRRMKSRDFMMTDIFMLYNTGQFDKFQGKVDTMLNEHGDEPVWLTGIADVYAYKLIHQYDKAEELYRRALERNQWYRPAFDNLLAMFRELREYDKIVKLMSDYPHLGEYFAANKVMKAFALTEQDRYDEGVKLFKNSIGPVKGNVSFYEDMINILMRKNEFDRVEDMVAFMLEQEPDNPDMLVLAAVTNSDLLEFDRAYRQAEQVLKLEPDNLEALIQKAYCTYERGNKEEGYRMMGQLLKDNFGDKTINLYASRIYISDNKEMGKVGNWSRLALSKDRYGLKSYMNLADYYMKQEKYTFARQQADNTVAIFDNDPRAYFVQGRALYYENKNLEEAKKSLEKAIEFGLKGKDLTEAKKILGKL